MNDAAFREALGRESAAICLVMLKKVSLRNKHRERKHCLTLLRWKEDFAERFGVVCRIITELLLARLEVVVAVAAAAVLPPPPPAPLLPPKSKWCKRLSLPPMVFGPCCGGGANVKKREGRWGPCQNYPSQIIGRQGESARAVSHNPTSPVW